MINRIAVIDQDITKLRVDAIVNAANSALSGGGGVDGAIHAAAGPELLEECRTLGRCPAGSAVMTSGYKLPAKRVIHVVGPAWSGGCNGEAELLKTAHVAAMTIARAHDCKSLAFPAISCGAYKYPPREAAAIAMDALFTFLDGWVPGPTVVFCCPDPTVRREFQRSLARHLTC